MGSLSFWCTALAVSYLASNVLAQSPDQTQYVNVLFVIESKNIGMPINYCCSLGTQGGNMFPGVVPRPFSVVKLGPDLYNGGDAYSGYLPNGNVTGISMMHESGTGGAPKYGVVSQQVVVGNISNPLVDLSVPRAVADQGQVGSYQVSLASGVTVALAGTSHAGMYQYEFPSSDSNIVVDVSHVLPSFRGLGTSQYYVSGNISVASDGHYEGSGTYDGGWNLGKKC